MKDDPSHDISPASPNVFAGKVRRCEEQKNIILGKHASGKASVVKGTS